MSSVNRPQVSGVIGNVISFIQDHLFSSRHPLIVTVAALALARVGYLIVQEGVRKCFTSEAHKEGEDKWSVTSTSSEEEDPATSTSFEEGEVTDLFFRITGKNIPDNCPVYLLGSDYNRLFSQYPENIVHSLKNCQALVASLPICQRPAASIREFVVEELTRTLNKLQQRDEAWFRSQFMLLGCNGDHLEEQMELVKKAQAATNLTLESWQPDLAFETIEIIQKHLKNYELDPLKTHPLVVMSLLGNELDLLEEVGDGIEINLISGGSWIWLHEISIMSANLTHEFIAVLACFVDEDDLFQNLHRMFCERLEIGYSNDEESKDDHLKQPGLYRDRFIEMLSKDPSHPAMVTLQSTIAAKNRAWQAQILEALQQNKSTAIVLPRDNLELDRETKMIKFLRSQGYTLELVINT